MTNITLALPLLLALGSAPPPQAANPTGGEGVRQLIESLPPKSMWRNMLEKGAMGDGIRRPWMDEMRMQGIKFAAVTYEFEWTQGGAALKDWRLASTRYFTDYDYLILQSIMDPIRLKAIHSSGLEAKLEAVALARAKHGIWIESPRDQRPARQTGTGYRQIFLADNEWLPVQMFPWFGQYEPGTTSLMHAALLGEVERIRALLAEGVDVNAVSANGSTALLYATEADSPETVQTLLAAGADPNKATTNGSTALMISSAGGDVRLVGMLVKAGANPNSRDASGDTALSIATQRNQWEVVKLLKLAGVPGRSQ